MGFGQDTRPNTGSAEKPFDTTLGSSDMQLLLDQTVAGQQLSSASAAALLRDGDALLTLGRAASKLSTTLSPEKQATFAIGCPVSMTGSRTPQQVTELTDTIDAAVAADCTEITFVSEKFSEVKLEALISVLSRAKQHAPQLHYGLQVPGDATMVLGQSIQKIFFKLSGSGLSFVVVENLTDLTVSSWLRAVDFFLGIGVEATPTVMLGVHQTPSQRIAQFSRIRDWQEVQNSTDASIQRRQSCLLIAGPGATGQALSPFDYLQTLSILRLFLPSTTQIITAWNHVGREVAQLSLSFGASDLGVIQPAGLNDGSIRSNMPRLSRGEMVRLIRTAGWIPAQRDSSYQVLETFLS